MATHLQERLRSLCWESEWNYAVFWKLNHHVPMVLTWEDAYYNSNLKHDASESKGSSSESLQSLPNGQFAHDPLGVAMAKMSHHVYSLGEGIVGEVAVTGRHEWISAGDNTVDSCLSQEIYDEWQEQFSAGIKTVVVAAVVPHGVVQLGSLNEVKEDFKLLTHIRDLFTSLQDPLAYHVQNPIQCSIQNMLDVSYTSTRTFGPDALHEYILDPDRTMNESYGTSFPGVHLSEPIILNEKNQIPEVIENVRLIQSGVHQSTNLPNDNHHRSNGGGIRNAAMRQVCSSSQSCITGDSTSYGVKLSAERSQVGFKVEKSADIMQEFNYSEAMDDLKSSFMFSGGSELHEALGPAFVKQHCHFSREGEKLEERSASHMPEITESSLLTSDSSSDHLLEAVVANFCRKDVTVKSGVSFSTSESMLTTEKMPEPSIKTSRTIGSSGYSIGCSSLLEENTKNCLNSSDSSNRSSTSAYRDTLVRPFEPGKPNKKRARPGENPRPRPRDRQLIQDRIKELRELVPNGSKCSIDSLLERTIKHMVFMQSATKHADKLSNCAKSRGCSKERGVLGSGYEQGSSWAVEVGGQMKICPILVENLNVNGQMLIEMLCEDCDNFLEIAEAIRNLGLTILTGITDNHGDKTWMRFIVEGQSNRNLHRMEVLWSLVQLLESKATA